MEQIIPVVLALACGLVQGEWNAPDSIPIPCGERGSTCDIWTEYCHYGTCMKCNTVVCSLPLNPGSRPVQCFFFCEKVKKMMQMMKELEITTSSALQTSTTVIPTKAPEHVIPGEACSSPDLRIETVFMVIISIACYISGIATLPILSKCRSRKNKRNRPNGPDESELGDLLKETGVARGNPRGRAENLNSHPPQGTHSGTTDPQGAMKLAISAK